MTAGQVTGLHDGAIEGWIAEAASGPALEGVVHGGGPFGDAVLTPRAEGGLRFAIPIPEDLKDGQIRFIDVRANGEEGFLAGGPVMFDGCLFEAGPAEAEGDAPAVEAAGEVAHGPAPADVTGAAELASPVLRGWLWSPGDPQLRLTVEIVIDGEVVAAVRAESFRKHLKRAGVGDANYGFEVDISARLSSDWRELIVRPAGGETPIATITRARPVGPDGEVDLPGYLDGQDGDLLAALPFEHLAFDAARMSRRRIVPRMLNRLRRERLAVEPSYGEALLLTLPGASPDAARRIWSLQSYPACCDVSAAQPADQLRERVRQAGYVFFARPGDMLHPSAASVMTGYPGADAVMWSRFSADQPVAGAPGTVTRRAEFDSITARHGALTDSTLALRGAVLAEAPDRVLEALAAGRLHPLFFWLAGQPLDYRLHAAALTSSLGAVTEIAADEVKADQDFFQQMLADEGDEYTLETVNDGPFPFALMPARRAAKTSVVICFRDRAGLTLRTIHSFSRQRLTGELELVLVDNQSTPQARAAVLDGARRMLGPERVVTISYDAPFNHSAQNNLGVEAASGEVVLIANNDVVLADEAAVEQLSAWALQPGVGSVGCRLENPERPTGSYGHRYAALVDDPYQSPLQEDGDLAFSGWVHTCAGATLACAAMAREQFLALGGLDALRFPIGYNDVDLMLRASRADLRHLYLGHVAGEHVRGASRTGDNEDIQALWANELTWPAGFGRFRQLTREQVGTPIETSGESAAASEAAPPIPQPDAESDELQAAVRESLEMRRMLERQRAAATDAFAKASELIEEMRARLAAVQALTE